MTDRVLEAWDGHPVETWERRWRIPRLEVYESLPSTNDRARELAEAGADPLTTVIAEAQTAGRGRGGRSWHSPPGRGLWLSAVLPGTAGDHLRLPLVIGLGVARVLARAVPGAHVALKWPNDVLVGGAKVCGILCERTSRGPVVVGIGVNVSQHEEDFPVELRGRATSLEASVRRPVARAWVAGGVLDELRLLVDVGVPALTGELGRRLRDLDALRGRRIVTSTGCAGRALGIDEEGALLVEAQGEVRRVVAGTVRLAQGESMELEPPREGDACASSST